MPSLSFRKAFENDRALLLWTMAVGVSSAVLILGVFPQWRPQRRAFGRTLVSAADAPFLYSIVFILAVVSLVGLLRRLHTLKVLCLTGVELSGRVASLRLRRHGGRATVVYEYQGTLYQARVALYKTAASSALSEGVPVPLLVDPVRPRKAIISRFYTNDA